MLLVRVETYLIRNVLLRQMSSNPDKLLYVQPKFLGFKIIRPKHPCRARKLSAPKIVTLRRCFQQSISVPLVYAGSHFFWSAEGNLVSWQQRIDDFPPASI